MSKKLQTYEKPCDGCGAKMEVNASQIARGRGRFCSKSCNAKLHATKHGHSGKRWQSPTYLTWTNMRQRCENPKSSNYPEYGALGIGVCQQWQTFAGFLADMGERPHGKTLDRIDGSKGYSPDNCRWATSVEQSDNLRTTLWVDYRGERMPLGALARMLGLKKETIRYRMDRGWSDDAVASPAEHGNRSRGLPV